MRPARSPGMGIRIDSEKMGLLLDQLISRICKRQEPVRFEAFGAEPAIEGFNEGIVRWHARAREVELDAAPVGPVAREGAEAGYIAAYQAGRTIIDVCNLEAVLKAKGLTTDL